MASNRPWSARRDALAVALREVRCQRNVGALDPAARAWRARLPAVTIELSTRGELDRLDETSGLVIYRLGAGGEDQHGAPFRRNQGANHDCANPRGAIESTCWLAENGRGAAPQMPRNGLGLIGMRERVAALGGELKLATTPDERFKVTARLPFHTAPA